MLKKRRKGLKIDDNGLKWTKKYFWSWWDSNPRLS